MKKYCFGIDIGGTTIKLGLFDVSGSVLDKWEIPTRKEEKGKNIIGDIAQALESKIAEKNIAKEDIAGAGMGIPGPTMEDGYVQVCVNLGWSKCNPAEELSKLIGIPVKAGNDANVAALGETWKGGGEGFLNSVMITLGTGVGGGVIINGKMAVGNRGLCGELGHITVEPKETDACNCGNHGCLEQYASATGVVRVAKKLLAETDKASVLRNKNDFSAKDVFDAAKEKDAAALEAVDILGQKLGQVLASVTLIIDPDVFIIGGGVSRAGSILTDAVIKYYNKYTIISEKKAAIALATLGNDAGIFGAARMVLD